MSRILVTRPQDEAAAVARELQALGHQPVIEPLLTMVWLDGPEPDLTQVQALLVTSANGVRALARRTPRRDIPVLAVGGATAKAAAKAGFARIDSAAGDVEALAELVLQRCHPAAGPLFHAAGSVVAGDLGGRLGAAGFTLQREVLYEAHTAEHLSEATAALWHEGGLDGVLLFSPRTAGQLVRLVESAGLGPGASRISAHCLSAAVARAAAPLPWRAVLTAERPDQDALLATLA